MKITSFSFLSDKKYIPALQALPEIKLPSAFLGKHRENGTAMFYQSCENCNISNKSSLNIWVRLLIQNACEHQIEQALGTF